MLAAGFVGAILLSDQLGSASQPWNRGTVEETVVALQQFYPDWPAALVHSVADGTVSEKQAKKHPDWSAAVHVQVARGGIELGMTHDMVLASRGRPADVNRYVNEWGVTEQWVYDCTRLGYGLSLVSVPCHYLYFQDGILTSWSDI